MTFENFCSDKKSFSEAFHDSSTTVFVSTAIYFSQVFQTEAKFVTYKPITLNTS